MLMTLIRKEMMHHILSVRFVALLLMCLLLVPLTLHINYRTYLQNQINYQESVKLSGTEDEEKPPDAPAPDLEVSKLFLEPDAFKRVRERFRGIPSELSWHDTQWRKTRFNFNRRCALSPQLWETLISCLSPVLSLVCWHYCLRLMLSPVKEKQAHFGLPWQTLSSPRSIFVEQTDWWIHCFRCSVPCIVSLRFAPNCLTRISFGRV